MRGFARPGELPPTRPCLVLSEVEWSVPCQMGPCESSKGAAVERIEYSEHDPNHARDARLLTWWIVAHAVIVSGTMVFLIVLGMSDPTLSVIVGATMAAARVLEDVLLLRAMNGGIVRRIVSRRGWRFSLILYSSFGIPITILAVGSTLVYMFGIGPGPASFAVFVGVNAGFAIPNVILSSNMNRRIGSLYHHRKDQCINCGYPFDSEGQLCSECGYSRWSES